MNTTLAARRAVVSPRGMSPAGWLVLVGLLAFHLSTAHAQQSFKVDPAKERELLAILRSDAPSADKAIACKRLAIDGSSAAVPDLAKLLHDPQLASWARIALEAIPGADADAALRAASESLEGRQLIGVLNSLGVRRDAKAVELLAARMRGADAEVASAAAAALGQIGDEAATRVLRQALAAVGPSVRSAVAEGCVLCAERRMTEEKFDAAAEIYDEVRNAEVPRQRVLEATRGAILARGDRGLPLLLEQLRSPDKGRFQIGLSTAREFVGGEVDKSLAAELATASPERAALIVLAMADRPATVVRSALTEAAGRGPKPVRLAALAALARVGDASCLPTLLESALDSDAELSQRASATLAELPGAEVDARIASMLSGAKGGSYPLLIELVGRRRIAATAELLKALQHADAKVRTAALAALGETVDQAGLKVLVGQAVAPAHAEDGETALKALKAASVRMPDREACATELAGALDRATATPTKGTILEILGAVGGAKALATVGAAARSATPELQDAGSRLLGEWMTADAAPVLLDLVDTAPEEKYRSRALRGYLRIARQFVLPEAERAEMCRKVLAATKQPAERRLIFDVLRRYPHVETLQVAIDCLQEPELKEDATTVALTIAQALHSKGTDVTGMLAKAGFEPVKLEILKAEYGAGSTQRDVTAVVRKFAGNLPLIVLTPPSYNAAFGGDPAPGVVKQLKIQYRLNGQEREASFAEDAPINLK